MEPLERSISSSQSPRLGSPSHSEDLSSAADNLGAVQYKIGRTRDEKLESVRDEPALPRSRTYSHFSLKRQFRGNRTVSDGSILQESRKKKVWGTFSNWMHRLKPPKKEDPSPQSDEWIENEDFSVSELGKEPRPFSREEAKAFLFKDSSESQGLNALLEELPLSVDFDGPLKTIIKNFLDVDQAKKDALNVNAQLIEARKGYRYQKKMLLERIAHCSEANLKMELQAQLENLVPVKGKWIQGKRGSIIQVERLRLLSEPQLRLRLPLEERGIELVADFIFSVLPTTIQFTYHKEGHLKYAMNGLLVMELESSLQ